MDKSNEYIVDNKYISEKFRDDDPNRKLNDMNVEEMPMNVK
jgi:hypothetical protein